MAELWCVPDSGDPADILCGTAKLTKFDRDMVESLEDCIDWMKEAMEDKVRDETPHGECGASEDVGIFTFENKTFEIKVEFYWGRHDKRYYYLDETEVVYCKEVELSPAQKGVVEILWDIFGGAINSKGYKELDSHIGAIYGDAITLEKAQEICQRLADKGFASTNVVLGIGLL